jgi:hypothetical protein
MTDEGAMSFGITIIDADGNELEARPGEIPPGCIGAVLEGPSGSFVAVPAPEETIAIDGNLGVYETFKLAAEALKGNHRQEWTREERQRASGGW